MTQGGGGRSSRFYLNSAGAEGGRAYLLHSRLRMRDIAKVAGRFQPFPSNT